MFSKFLPKPLSLPLPSLPPKPFLSPPLRLATTLSTSLNTYGPSLTSGHKPHPTSNEQTLDENSFTRIYDVAALRVPSERCFALENRIRGHLLNWPRVPNVARVPGDEIDREFRNLVTENDGRNEGDEEGVFVSLNRRVYGKAEGDGERLSPVLYRDKLARSFNSRGYVKFRNLARISRPKKRKKSVGNRGNGRKEWFLVEVVESEEGDDMSGLLGEEFKGVGKWRGSTRLLLLDQRYALRSIEEMPEAVKVAFKDVDQSTAAAVELVRCKLTLFYSYWNMNEILEALLPQGMVVPSAFETVGHIAHLNFRDEHLSHKNVIAKVVLDKHRPKIQTVVNKIDAIQNNYRTMQLEVLAGNHSLVTTVVENGLRFQVDLATVYWNSKLATERQRLLDCFTQKDVVCDVFAGVGPIALSAAKKVKYVYANDLNPQAVEYLERNCVINKLERKIEVFNMDGRRFIDAIFTSERTRPVTQVVMNLPNDAAEYLDAFKGIFSEITRDKEFVLPKIHVYGFSKAQDPEFDFHERIRVALAEVAFEVEMRKVRLVAPGKWMLCASFTLPERVAFAKQAKSDL